MAISKVIFNGDTLMDTTQKTVTAGSMLSGVTALKNDGTGITGNIATKTSSNLTASGATVTAPAGYYASAASKAVASGTEGTPTATKGTVSSNSVSVTPSVTNTTGYITGGTINGTAVTVSASELVSGTKTISASGTTDVTNYAYASVAAGSATTPSTSITANPSISVSNSGLITASVGKSQSVTPTVSAGYVSSGTAGTITVSGSNTSQLTAQAAQTITPTTTNQTIASGKYLTGTQTILGDANLVAANIADGVTIFGVTGTHQGGGGGLEYEAGTWTPTADTNDTTISFANTHTSAPFYAILYDNQTTGFDADDIAVQVINSFINIYNKGSNYRSGLVAYVYTSSSGMSVASTQINSSDINNWLTSSNFRVYNSSRYFRSGHTYNWIAVWQPTA